MSELRLWPTCGRCCNDKQGWSPVEAYGIIEEPPTRIIMAKRLVVWAECSHGTYDERTHAGKKPDRQEAIIDMPHWWGDAHKLQAIAALVFFAPGIARPEHGLITDI